MDRILVFQKGRVVEQDDHASLLKRDFGADGRLYERQAGELAKGMAAA